MQYVKVGTNIIESLLLRSDYFLAHRLKLHFKVKVDSFSQDFYCRMSIMSTSVNIYIHDCKNSQGLILKNFFINELLSSKIKEIKPINSY